MRILVGAGVGVLVAVLAFVMWPESDASQADSAPSTAGPTPGSASDPAECQVTIPERFVPPPTHPAEPPVGVWFGSAELWTVLHPDGEWLPAKSVWWSARFPGGRIEERPALRVNWTRLDVPGERIDSEGLATNANSVDSGDFMIVTIDPPHPGCWRVTATYKDATLTYVVEVPG